LSLGTRYSFLVQNELAHIDSANLLIDKSPFFPTDPKNADGIIGSLHSCKNGSYLSSHGLNPKSQYPTVFTGLYFTTAEKTDFAPIFLTIMV
jgi:hypothetical protein